MNGKGASIVQVKSQAPVILVTPPSTAAAPTIAYNPGVIQEAIDLPHDDSNMYQCGLWLITRENKKRTSMIKMLLGKLNFVLHTSIILANNVKISKENIRAMFEINITLLAANEGYTNKNLPKIQCTVRWLGPQPFKYTWNYTH